MRERRRKRKDTEERSVEEEGNSGCWRISATQWGGGNRVGKRAHVEREGRGCIGVVCDRQEIGSDGEGDSVVRFQGGVHAVQRPGEGSAGSARNYRCECVVAAPRLGEGSGDACEGLSGKQAHLTSVARIGIAGIYK